MAARAKDVAHRARARTLGFCSHVTSSRLAAIAKIKTATIKSVGRSSVMLVIFTRVGAGTMTSPARMALLFPFLPSGALQKWLRIEVHGCARRETEKYTEDQ